jgi:hypothetical protein
MELSHSTREDPMIDLMAIAAVDRETEVTYIRKERDWMTRAREEGRAIPSDRMLPVLPASLTTPAHGGGHAHDGAGDGHAHAHGDGHGHR